MVIARALVALFLFSAVALSAGSQTFTGVIFDESCASGGHAQMRMGPTDAECTKACVDSHNVPYVLKVENTAYQLSDQKAAERFAGQRVTVSGTLDAAGKIIHVEAMAPGK